MGLLVPDEVNNGQYSLHNFTCTVFVYVVGATKYNNYFRVTFKFPVLESPKNVLSFVTTNTKVQCF